MRRSVDAVRRLGRVYFDAFRQREDACLLGQVEKGSGATRARVLHQLIVLIAEGLVSVLSGGDEAASLTYSLTPTGLEIA